MERKALLPRAESSQGQGQRFHWGFEALFFGVFSGAGIRSKVSFFFLSHFILFNKSSVRKNPSAGKACLLSGCV